MQRGEGERTVGLFRAPDPWPADFAQDILGFAELVFRFPPCHPEWEGGVSKVHLAEKESFFSHLKEWCGG